MRHHPARGRSPGVRSQRREGMGAVSRIRSPVLTGFDSLAYVPASKKLEDRAPGWPTPCKGDARTVSLPTERRRSKNWRTPPLGEGEGIDDCRFRTTDSTARERLCASCPRRRQRSEFHEKRRVALQGHACVW